MSLSVAIVCAQCRKRSFKIVGAVNRARKENAPLYCNRTCAGLARQKHKTTAQKKLEKRRYDQDYRRKNRAMLKAKKAAYFQRTYDPKAAAVERKKRMPYHVAYCRQPEYREKKHAYDVHRYHEKTFGPFANASLALRDLITNINERMTDYEIRSANQALRNPQVRSAEEGKRSSRDRDRPSQGERS